METCWNCRLWGLFWFYTYDFEVAMTSSKHSDTPGKCSFGTLSCCTINQTQYLVQLKLKCQFTLHNSSYIHRSSWSAISAWIWVFMHAFILLQCWRFPFETHGQSHRNSFRVSVHISEKLVKSRRGKKRNTRQGKKWRLIFSNPRYCR